MATTEEQDEVRRLCAEIVSEFEDGALEPGRVRRALQAIIEHATVPTFPRATSAGRFTSPDRQVANFRAWTSQFGLPWSSGQIDTVAADVPLSDGDEPLIALTLCWTLADLRSTIDVKLAIARLVYGSDKVSVTRYFKTDAKHTALVGGAPPFHAHRLWWQLIDLGANRFMAPNTVPAATAAGSEVLDVICQHPIYVSQQNGRDTPYLDLPGLSVQVQGITDTNTPDAMGDAEGKVTLQVRWEGSVSPDHAEPTREPQP